MPNNLTTRRILTYDDLVKVPAGHSNEQLADVRSYDGSIIAQYNKPDMLTYTGETILVRDTIARKLARVNEKLRGQGLGLKVVYGYRHPAVQQDYFDKRRSTLASETLGLSEDELDRLAHNFVAIPTVGGHPAGAAVDLTVVDQSGAELDMGTGIADYRDPDKIKTFAPKLTPAQQANRGLLHDLMVEQGFAPFYGEWWHFSYGDREWAAFYNKKTALYGAINKL